MALFAKKVEYWASMTSYITLLVLARKKGGKPISYIVYAYNSAEAPFVMRSFFTLEDAQENVSCILDGYFQIPWEGFITTSGWLHHVASGGGYQIFPERVWVRVPVPKLICRKRNRKPIQFGDVGFLYRQARKELVMLEDDYICTNSEIIRMENNLDDGINEDGKRIRELEEIRDVLAEKLRLAKIKASNILNELKFVRSKKTGIPLPESFCKEEIV